MSKKKVWLMILILIGVFSFYHYKIISDIKHDIGNTFFMVQMEQGDNLAYLEHILKNREISDEEFRTIHRMVKFDERISFLSGNKVLEKCQRKIDSAINNYFNHTISKEELVKELEELLKLWKKKILYKYDDDFYEKTYGNFRKTVWRR